MFLYLFFLPCIHCSLQELFLDTPIDHFSIFPHNETFPLRYLLLDDHHIKGGPILFYCGNEADIKVFYENTGFLLELATLFNALVVFAEHRYYGKSRPFGAVSFKPDNIKFLTTSQALGDFAWLINWLGKEYFSTMLTNDTYPVIAFGGSYGGMLSAWLRMKYPHLVLGAVASSAPLLQINNLKMCQEFYRIVTQQYNCSSLIEKSWGLIRNLTVDERHNLRDVFKLCKPLNNVDKFIDYLEDAYVNMAMLNYPYPTNFLTPLPAHPVKTFCDKLSSAGEDLLESIANSLQVYTNLTGQTKCVDYEMVDLAWDFQACFELIMPMCSSEGDMFENRTWNLEEYLKDCEKKFAVKGYNVENVLVLHGGKILKYTSNIIFSNGLKDPWNSGGILHNVSDTVLSIQIQDAPHHYDLRASNPVDSNYVVAARKFHISQIKKWLGL